MDEHGRDGQDRRLAAGEIAHAHALDAPFAEDRLERRPGPDLDLLALANAPAVRLLPVERLLRVDEHDLERRGPRARAPRGAPSRRLRPSRRPGPGTTARRSSAQWLRPLPSSSSSPGTPSLRGLVPVATTTAPATSSRVSVSTTQSPPRCSRLRHLARLEGAAGVHDLLRRCEGRARSPPRPAGSRGSPRPAPCSGRRRPRRADPAGSCFGPAVRRREPR